MDNKFNHKINTELTESCKCHNWRTKYKVRLSFFACQSWWSCERNEPFKRQSRKMVKHTETNRRQFAEDLFECVWPFYEFGAERVKKPNQWKAAQSTDVPVRVSNDDADKFADYICGFFNKFINSWKFLSILNVQTLHSFLR